MSEVNKVWRVSFDGKRKPYSETTTKTDKGYPIVDSQFAPDDGDQMAETFENQIVDCFKNFNIKGGIFIGINEDGRHCICSCVNGEHEARLAAYNAGCAVIRNTVLEARAEENYEKLALTMGKVNQAFGLGCSSQVEKDELPYLQAAIERHNEQEEE